MDPGMLPTDRESIELSSTERNPYSSTVKTDVVGDFQESVSEESRLRRIISLLKVGGLSGSGDNARVLLGSMILKPGLKLPPLVRDQFEELTVKSISPKELLLTFLERDVAVEPRDIVIALQPKPKVGQLLYGESLEKLTNSANIAEIVSPAVSKFLEDSTQVELQNFTTSKVELMGVSQDATSPKKPESR